MTIQSLWVAAHMAQLVMCADIEEGAMSAPPNSNCNDVWNRFIKQPPSQAEIGDCPQFSYVSLDLLPTEQ